MSVDDPQQPPPTEDRISALDLIRGVCLLMILPANIPFFAGFRSFMDTTLRQETTADIAVRLGTLFFVDFKFITQLAILFGVGLAIQKANARREGRPFAGYYLRRTGLLFLLGLAHGVLLWYGDILLTYSIVAVAALVLSGLRRTATLIVVGVLLTWAYGLTAVGGVAKTLGAAAGQGGGDGTEGMPPAMAAFFERFREENSVRVFLHGSYADIVAQQAFLVGVFGFLFGLLFLYQYLLACFLLGRHFLATGVFDPEGRPRAVRRFLLLGAFLGLPLHLAAVGLSLHPTLEGLATPVHMLGAIPLALGYFGLLLRWDGTGSWPWLQRRFRAVGRTALSNYLLQSVVCFFLFYGPGLGLYSRIDRVSSLGIVVGIWIFEIAVTSLWLTAFRMGPVEWVWRGLAEGRFAPLLRVRT